MFDPIADEDAINTARSRYNARKTESPLIAWICSDTWAPHPEEYPKSEIRGMRVYSGVGYTVGRANVVSGEIIASTCHCHKGNGKAW